jgi:hypothetical protein
VDIAGAVAWLNVPFESDNAALFDERDWTHHASGRAIAGWYWTEHWKSEVFAGRSNSAETWNTEAIQDGPNLAYRSINYRVQYTEVGFAQVYQFRRNEWVHPSLGAGVLFRQRTGESEFQPAVIYRAPAGSPIVVDPGGRRTLKEDIRAAPFVTAAVKMYFTPRAFFRSDLQVAFGTAESVAVNAGFGIDF